MLAGAAGIFFFSLAAEMREMPSSLLLVTALGPGVFVRDNSRTPATVGQLPRRSPPSFSSLLVRGNTRTRSRELYRLPAFLNSPFLPLRPLIVGVSSVLIRVPAGRVSLKIDSCYGTRTGRGVFGPCLRSQRRRRGRQRPHPLHRRPWRLQDRTRSYHVQQRWRVDYAVLRSDN